MNHRVQLRIGLAGLVLIAGSVWSACSNGGSSAGSSAPATSPAPSSSTRASAPGSSPAGTVSARVGDLVISGAYIPQPASPDVAAAYFTITNSGTRTDRLVAVHTNVAGQVMPMTETENGTTGSMSDLGSVQIPAGGTFAFTRGHAHLMLEKPNVTLREGDRVAVTVRFAHAGSVRFSIPVVPVTGAPDQSATRSGMTMSRSH